MARIVRGNPYRSRVAVHAKTKMAQVPHASTHAPVCVHSQPIPNEALGGNNNRNSCQLPPCHPRYIVVPPRCDDFLRRPRGPLQQCDGGGKGGVSCVYSFRPRLRSYTTGACVCVAMLLMCVCVLPCCRDRPGAASFVANGALRANGVWAGGPEGPRFRQLGASACYRPRRGRFAAGREAGSFVAHGSLRATGFATTGAPPAGKPEAS